MQCIKCGRNSRSDYCFQHNPASVAKHIEYNRQYQKRAYVVQRRKEEYEKKKIGLEIADNIIAMVEANIAQ